MVQDRTPPSEEAASLIRALAVELSFFCQKPKDGSPYLHLGVGWSTMCDFVADPRMPRKCSARCVTVRQALALAADRLGCSVEDFRQGHKPKRKKAAQPKLPTE